MSDATSDCELRDDWLLEQDVNAWSSLAYVTAGLVLAWEVRRARLPRAVYGLAAISVAEGFGSLLYHGAASDFGQFLHDVPLIGALAFVAGWHVGRLRDRADRGSLVGSAVGLVVSAALWALAPGATNIAVGVTVAVIAVASLIARRRSMAAVWSWPLLGLGAVAIGIWALGTPDSPACRAESWLQPHGLWHVLTAIVAIAWVDRAYAAADPDRAPRLFRRFTDRTIGLIARGLVLAFHRSVDVRWRDRMPRNRPALIVANHGNGLVDAVVVAAVLGRLPRFLAEAALWKVIAVRPFLWLVGVLPVYRSADGDRSSDNASVFDACHHELAQGATVAIFPEGTTGDRAGLDRVKSGAARIALGSLPTAPNLVIVPIGMAFESTVETRSRAVVMFGEPIVVAEFAGAGLAPDGEPDRSDAAALTERITQALEEVSDHWAGGMQSLHGIHVHGFPNLFMVTLSQAANLISNVPHNYLESGATIAAIIDHALQVDEAEGSEVTVEVTADAEQEWVERLEAGAVGRMTNSPDCTPGYYNNEGQSTGRRGVLNSMGYPEGPVAYFQYIDRWRSSGDFEGLEFQP